MTSAFCKDMKRWCRFVDCTIVEAAKLCPKSCNICESLEPEVKLENVDGDIVGRIVKTNEDHQLPDKVGITMTRITLTLNITEVSIKLLEHYSISMLYHEIIIS